MTFEDHFAEETDLEEQKSNINETSSVDINDDSCSQDDIRENGIKPKSNRKKVLLVILAFIVICPLFVCLIVYSSHSEERQVILEAQTVLDNSKATIDEIESAINSIEQIKEYRNSEAVLSSLKNKLTETQFNKAVEDFEKGEFDSALALFETTKNVFRESEDYLTVIPILKKYTPGNGSWVGETDVDYATSNGIALSQDIIHVKLEFGPPYKLSSNFVSEYDYSIGASLKVSAVRTFWNVNGAYDQTTIKLDEDGGYIHCGKNGKTCMTVLVTSSAVFRNDYVTQSLLITPKSDTSITFAELHQSGSSLSDLTVRKQFSLDLTWHEQDQ